MLLRLIDEAEQQEASEAILAYFVSAVIYGQRNDLTLREIDDACEDLLREATTLEIDFDVESTVRTLVKFGVMKAGESGWCAVSMEEANRKLEQFWDSRFDRV